MRPYITALALIVVCALAVLAGAPVAAQTHRVVAPVAEATPSAPVVADNADSAPSATPSPAATPESPVAAPQTVQAPIAQRTSVRAATTVSAPRQVLADHAYAQPSWTSTYLTCDSYAYTGQRVTDSYGTLWVGVDCGWVPNGSRPTGVPTPVSTASEARTT